MLPVSPKENAHLLSKQFFFRWINNELFYQGRLPLSDIIISAVNETLGTCCVHGSQIQLHLHIHAGGDPPHSQWSTI